MFKNLLVGLMMTVSLLPNAAAAQRWEGSITIRLVITDSQSLREQSNQCADYIRADAALRSRLDKQTAEELHCGQQTTSRYVAEQVGDTIRLDVIPV